MRLPSGVTDQYIYFVAVDATDLSTRETGLTTFTVYRSRNGGVAAAMTTPTINEVDATNLPGVYELLVDEDTTLDSGDDTQEMVFHITHAGMAPVTRTIELFRPKVTAGETLTVSSGVATDTITNYGLDHLVSASVAGTDVTDNSIMAKLVSASATADWDDFVNTTDSLQALRDRGDAAWTTGGGGSISDILQWQLLVPPAIDLANTAAYQIAIALTNQLDDLPTTAEIVPGTISIARKAQGGTTWSDVVTDDPMDESAGLIYYNAVFDTASGYSSGDMIRVTLKGQKITVSANDYEIADGTNGIIAYTGIVADTPDVNIASISGSSTAADVLELFALALNQGTGQLDSGSFTADSITSSVIQDGAFTAGKFASSFLTATKIATDAFTAAKFAADVTTELQSGLATAAALATVDANVDAILVDTGTTLPGILGTPAGADMSADIAALQTTANAVETDTQDIQSRLPASLNNGAIQADIQRINDVAVVGDGSATPFTV